MKKSLYNTMTSDRKTFKKYASAKQKKNDILNEHYPMLDRCARQSAEECRKAQKQLKDPELLPGLFDKCVELCSNGILPETVDIIGFFANKLNGIIIAYLPLAITCALLHKCAEAIINDNKKLLENSVLSLQKMRNTDFDFISEKLFSAEEILLSEPAGIYPYMDSEAKKRYRRKIAYLAIKKGKPESEFAAELMEKARKSGKHIGSFLFSATKSKTKGIVYLVLEAIMPLMICFSVGMLSGEWLIMLLLYFPIWEILRYPIQRAGVKGDSPKKLLSLDPDSEAVLNTDVLITLSVILPSADKMNKLKDKLEELYLSNAVGNIKVCCLADFKEADMMRKPEDKHIMSVLNKVIDELNNKYGGGFAAAVRPRSYSETQNKFIGKERKRGAIRELIRAIKGNEKGFLSIIGDTEHLKDTKYLIALDYDSTPVFDSLRELVAIAEHPVNKPVIKNGRVVSGYGIIAPKTQNSLSSASKTFFSSVMSRNSGVSSYDLFSCERYNELFGESIFCGKGLINVAAYHELLDEGIPREKILSHDIIEGEFLRTAYAPEVQIIEEFPETADAYYKRLHRWVRGDWQNSDYIIKKNPLNFVSRFKIFDNLRRSVVSTSSLAAIIYSAVYQGNAGIAAAVVAAFALCAADVFAGISSVAHGGIRTVTGLYYSKKLPEALDCFVRAFLSVSYSVRDAVVCSDAAIRALWRMLISGDNLLEWTTSAEQNEKKESFVSWLPALAVAAFLVVFGLPIHRMTGIILLFEIPLTFFGNSPITRPKRGVSAKQREYLLSNAAAMWGYFEDLCGKENNYLPPDNIQFAPYRTVAERTSPTNIGLMLACFVAARDFGFITTDELCRRLNLSLSSIEKLEKYKGNLLNWYSTSTLETLEPRFVSAVDSGNYLCCLTAVKEGILEYANECKELKNIAERIEKMLDSTDLSVMYNKQRRLFRIGINPDSGEKTESCYDLYMSEIRMTAYLAVARKQVPKNHWYALDRPLVRSGRYMGLVSWTGTMFEYFMADIFIPAPLGSLSDEALRFCLQSQRKKAGRNPFGLSESAFYAFDGDLNYQYKAHGVQKLGFKRGLDKENVISPYSSFLTMNIAPQLSLKNLKKLEKLGVTGKYGFFEAADFTSGRNNGKYSVISSFMVHHLGMSFLATDNLINGRCMQKRFMSDRFMKGAESLLDEKAPFGKEAFKDVVSDTVIPRLRERISDKSKAWNKPDINSPLVSVFANSRTTLCIGDTGAMKVMLDGKEFFSVEQISDSFICDEKNYPFCKRDMEVKLTESYAEFRSIYDEFILTMQIYLLKTDNCIIKKYTIKNKSTKNDVHGRIVSDFNPEKQNGVYAEYGFIKEEALQKRRNHESEITIGKESSEEMLFVIAAESTEDEAVNLFEAIKTRKGKHKKASNPFFADSFQKALSEKYLSDIIKKETNKAKNSLSEFGITAEYPVVLAEVKSKDNLNSVKPLIVFNKTLRNCGIKNTLAVYCNAQNISKTSALQTIETFLNEEGCDLMLGIGGGVYVFYAQNHSDLNFDKLKDKSTVYLCC